MISLAAVPVEIVSPLGIMSGELKVLGRTANTLNDAEETLSITNVGLVPLAPGVPSWQGAPGALLLRAQLPVVAPMAEDPAGPENDGVEMISRFLACLGPGLTIKGQAKFPALADPTQHMEMLVKGRYFPAYDAEVSFHSGAPARRYPKVFINRTIFWAVVLG